MNIDKLHVDEKTFLDPHEQDRMASDKPAEGIDGYSKARVSLETLLMEVEGRHVERGPRPCPRSRRRRPVIRPLT
jgi:hypothetical protein